MSLFHLRSVTKSHPHGPSTRVVLRDASLTVERGSVVSVYGGRDAGKTTLLRIAAGFDAPDSGEVIVAGQTLDTLSKRELLELRRRTLGWVGLDGPYDRQLSIASYVALPLYRTLGQKQARLHALRALAAVDAERFGDEHWDDLSNASQTLCAIARAMVCEPRILIADDPVAGVSFVDRERICCVLRAIAEEKDLGVLVAVPNIPATLRSHVTRALVRGRLLGPADHPPLNVIRMPLRRSA